MLKFFFILLQKNRYPNVPRLNDSNSRIAPSHPYGTWVPKYHHQQNSKSKKNSDSKVTAQKSIDE